ncbi:MAG: MFS transporter, partial [Candidatus Wallbacteria bacterium]|nr:MFS transporter [Candidatus Wallbacteria bacterium]
MAHSKLWNKDFFLLWQGQLVSQLGNQAFAIAMAFWIKHQTGSASIMGLVMMAATLPSVLLGPFGGTFADMHSRKKIIVFCDLFNGMAVLSLAALIMHDPLAVELILPWLFAVSVFVSIVNAFFRPAVTASIPDIVPEQSVAAANSLNESSVQIATFTGQALGGVLFRLFGPAALFLIDGSTYIFSSFSEVFIHVPQNLPAQKPGMSEIMRSFREDTLAGFRFVWERKGMRNMYLVAAVLNFFLVPVIVLLPFYVEDFLKAGTVWYGYLMAAFGAGSLIGYLFAGT